jgi:uncharacterized protein (TIGR03437 family)
MKCQRGFLWMLRLLRIVHPRNIVAGVLQINVQIPADAPVGPSIPIVVRVGNTFSQAGVTIAIK